MANTWWKYLEATLLLKAFFNKRDGNWVLYTTWRSSIGHQKKGLFGKARACAFLTWYQEAMHSESQIFKTCIITPEIINKIESYRKTININLTLDEALEKQKMRSKTHLAVKASINSKCSHLWIPFMRRFPQPHINNQTSKPDFEYLI